MSLETLSSCPVCKSKLIHPFSTIKDHSVSGEQFAIVKCSECNFLFTNPRPDAASLGNYYKSENYISHTNKSNNPVNLIYKLARTQTLRWKYNLIKRFQPKFLLDYGCGTGHFLSYCKNKGLDAFGYEPDDTARSVANHNMGGSVVATPTLLNKEYDVVTLWHVLEHIPDLNDVMAWLKKHLAKGGRLVIALPNAASFDAQLFQEFWAAYDVPRHLYHFTKESFTGLAKKHGFCIESIHPMKLDAYYVSLLSNQYKYKGLKPIKSFINGLKSNTYAKKGMNYSSLIYVLQHEEE